MKSTDTSNGSSILLTPLTRIRPLFATLIVCLLQISQTNLSGLANQLGRNERKFEQAFLQLPDSARCREYLFELTRLPNHAGSPGDRKNAEYIDSLYKSFGLHSEIVEYYAYIPYPVEVTLEILEPERRMLLLKEKNPEPFEQGALVPFNAYSPSGEVTGEIVYVNRGLTDDYRKLKELDVNVQGKIVLARYGGAYRGIKVEQAARNGAIGLILYSDPIDDGYVVGDIFPHGPMRPWDAVQRGSINSGGQYVGDLLTPGWASTKEAKRLKLEETKGLPKIPTTPISYDDAQHLLKHLGGPPVPRESGPSGANWQGGLPFTYHTGPGPTKVHMKLRMDYQLRPIWNNISTIPGVEEPEKKIIFGSHRDAWVYGAQDPHGGTATLIELGRTLSELRKQGWNPRRTIVIAHWDGEEYSLIGSTEWGEEHADDLRKNAIAYLNFDAAIGGPNFSASSVPSLDKFVRDLTRDVMDPKTNQSVYRAWWKNQNREQAKAITGDLPDTPLTRIGRMGGGSDHMVFLDHLGIPSLGFGFGGAQGIYHSSYDNFEWMDKFGDPGFHYHATLVKLQGLAAIRLADAEILPFDYVDYASEVVKDLNEIEKRTEKSGKIDFTSAKKKAAEWKQVAEELRSKLYDARREEAVNEAVNRILIRIERELTEEQGLAGREWYKHRIYTPSGYTSIALAGIADAFQDGKLEIAREELQVLLRILDRVTQSMSEALQALQ